MPRRAKQDYRRYCIGCHGPAGDGNGENAQWIEPKPRDFTAAVFKCRSTPTGTLPTDADLYHSVSRGFVTSNMPSWLPLTRQTRVDLVAYVKTFSPRWKAQGVGHADRRSAGNAGDGGKHSSRAGAVPEAGMLEVPRPRGSR